jgi:hypothetical protein
VPKARSDVVSVFHPGSGTPPPVLADRRSRSRLKGIHWTTQPLADGTRETYWYAWRGGPRLRGEPGTAEFIASYHEAAARKARHRDNHSSVVYLIEYGQHAKYGHHRIKIGVSKNFKNRFADLRRGSSTSLSVLAVFPGDRDFERQLHALFAHLRIRHEFFRSNDLIRSFVDIAKRQSLADAIAYVEAQCAPVRRQRGGAR